MTRVITGGQSGCDLAAWIAAKACGLETGGWMPWGYFSEFRPAFAVPPSSIRDYFASFGAEPLEDDWSAMEMAAQYRERTKRNVQRATHVLVITSDPDSPGTRLTWRLAHEFERDRFAVNLAGSSPPEVDEVHQGYYGTVARAFVRDCFERGGTLMVAGTRESKCPGIQSWTESFLAPIFRALSGIPDGKGD